MKNLFASFLLFSTVLTFGQAPTQKEILELPNIDLVKDFNYKTSKKTPILILQKWYTKPYDEFKHVQNNEYTFDKNSLKLKKYRSKHFDGFYDYWTVYTFTYKNNLLQERIITEKEKVIDHTTFLYDNKNKIVTVNELFGDFVKALNYSYPNSNTIIKTNKKTDTKTGIVLLDIKRSFTLVNNLIKKEVLSKPKVSKEHITDYEYYDHNLLKKKSPYETFLGAFQPSSSSTIGYKYNDSGDLKSEISITGINDIQQLHFEYIYDDYGNWIAKFRIWQKDIYDSNSKITTEIHIRNIEYSDKTTTGYTSIDTPQIQDYLESKKFAASKPPNDGIYWSKVNNEQFRFFENGKNVSGQFNFVKLLKGNFYANDSIKNIVYQIKDFTTKPIQKEYYKATVFANKDEGIWYKNEKDNFWVIVNGKYLKNLKVINATTNRKNRIIYVDNVPTYVLLYEDANPFEMQKAIKYENYLKTHPNEGKKEVVEEIPSGAVWKKADNGGFWFYFNRESRSQLNYINYGNHCVIYDSLNNTTYLLDNIKTENVGKFLKAIPYPGNKFWYKSTTESFEVIINGQKDTNITSAKYTQNGIDVVTINKNNQKEYVLKDYKNQPLFLLYPVTNYSDYSEKPSVVYLENEELKKCEDDGKCYAGLFNTKVASILSDTNISDKPKELSIYMEKLYRVNPSMVQKVGMLTQAEYLGIYMKAKKILPQHIQDDIAKRSRQMIEDYNKYINSKEVRDKVKELGGYIKSKN